MCDSASSNTSSAGRVCTCTASWLPIVPLGTNSADSLPVSVATRRSSAITVGSSPNTSSPTSASAMAFRMAAVGLVTVSLRRSTGGSVMKGSSNGPERDKLVQAHIVGDTPVPVLHPPDNSLQAAASNRSETDPPHLALHGAAHMYPFFY